MKTANLIVAAGLMAACGPSTSPEHTDAEHTDAGLTDTETDASGDGSAADPDTRADSDAVADGGSEPPVEQVEPTDRVNGAREGVVDGSGSPSEPPLLPEGAFDPPQHPFMAANPGSNIHNDAWMSDAYGGRGPAGARVELASAGVDGLCATVAFDRWGRIVTLCISLDDARLLLIDPATMGLIDSFELPPRDVGDGAFTNFTGGGYFYVDHQDRAIVGCADEQVRVVAMEEYRGGTRFALEQTIDLRPALGDASLVSVLPDWEGTLWFAADSGVVGWIAEDGTVVTRDLGAGIANSFAVDSSGVYVVTNSALHRLGRGTDSVEVVWTAEYGNTGIQKPGQVAPGSGTTPTILEGGFVAIADNADPMQVVVYRVDGDDSEREVCAVPVFGTGTGATDNSLIGAGRSLFVENNHGYEGPEIGAVGPVTVPGFARIDVRSDASGCDLVWSNPTVMAPTVVPKLSVADGLVYAFIRPGDAAGHHRWAWAALSAETGEVVWTAEAGDGVFVNNNYAGLALGRDGTAYLGVLGGLLAVRPQR